MTINLQDYARFVKAIIKSHPRLDGDHILVESGTKEFRAALGAILSTDDVKATAKCTCRYKNCINPEHFLITFEENQDIDQERKEELNILMDDIDFDRLEEVGTDRYLEEYNEGMPEELKIDLPTLMTCIKLHRKEKRRSSPDMKNALTIGQFVERIGYSAEWVSRLIKKGKITPRVRGAGQRYFLQSDVEDWLEGNPSPLFNKEAQKGE